MELVGYGAFQMDAAGIRGALDAGYRLIDTAESYRNEQEVGAVLHEYMADTGLPRSAFTVVSKCSSSRGTAAARANLERQLRDLRVEYIDIYYLHSREQDPTARQETWQVMEDYYRAGKLRALGISNHYHNTDVDEILSIATIKPHVVQNKFDCLFAGFVNGGNRNSVDPIAYFHSLGIAYVAYSTLSGWPLHQLGVLSPKDDPHVAFISQRVGRTPTQVLLRWSLQHGAAVIPTSRSHAADNAALFDFALSEAEMAYISGLAWLMAVPGENVPHVANVLEIGQEASRTS